MKPGAGFAVLTAVLALCLCLTACGALGDVPVSQSEAPNPQEPGAYLDTLSALGAQPTALSLDTAAKVVKLFSQDTASGGEIAIERAEPGANTVEIRCTAPDADAVVIAAVYSADGQLLYASGRTAASSEPLSLSLEAPLQEGMTVRAFLLGGDLKPLAEKAETVVTDEQEEPVSEMLRIEIGTSVLTADFAETEAAEGLRELLRDGPVEVSVRNFGGWEKVGSLPRSLPQDDVQQTAKPGDIMLYTGNQIVLFYGDNTWAYTKLGTITGASAEELRTILGGEETSLTLSLSGT